MIHFYSIYDKKVKMFNLPFAAPNDQSAVLAVRQSMLEDVAKIKYLNKAATDLELHCVGQFDQIKGIYVCDSDYSSAICGLDAIFDFEGGSDDGDQV